MCEKLQYFVFIVAIIWFVQYAENMEASGIQKCFIFKNIGQYQRLKLGNQHSMQNY